MIGSHRDIYRTRFTNRFPVVQSFHQSEMLCILVNNIGNFQKIILSFDRRSMTPGSQCTAGCRYCLIYVFLSCFCTSSQNLAIGRIMCLKRAAVRCGNKLTINKKTVLFLKFCVDHKINRLSKNRECNAGNQSRIFHQTMKEIPSEFLRLTGSPKEYTQIIIMKEIACHIFTQ